MLRAGNLDRGNSNPTRPGDTKVPVCTAPDTSIAGLLVRALVEQGIDCSSRQRSVGAPSPSGEIQLQPAVDVLVRDSDLERARRIVRRYLDA